MSIASYAGWPAYDTFLIVSLSGWPVYDLNPLKSNPNPKKPVLGSCHVRGLGQTLTPILLMSLSENFLIAMVALTTVANLAEEIDKFNTSGTKMIITTNLEGVKSTLA